MIDPISRRAFLRVPSATLALAGAPAILPGQSPADTVRVAFIGVGNRGSFLLENMLKVAGVKVVAVCDIVPDRAQKAAATVEGAGGGKPEIFADFRKMLDQRKDIDAVVAATFDYTHRDVFTTVLEMGRHLYGEKPMALSPQDCQVVLNAAKTAKGILQIGFQLRFDPRNMASEQFIHKGGIGKVLMCHGMRFGGDLPRDIPWYFDRAKSGDMIVDQGIHILDLFHWAIGKRPLRAMGSGGTDLFVNRPPGRTVMDNYNVLYDYPASRVNFSHHYFDPPGFCGHQVRVFGSEGAIDLRTATWQPREKRSPAIKLEVPDAAQDSTYLSLAAYIDNVRNHRQPPINGAASAMESTVVALMGARAVQEKRIVAWEEMAG